MKDLWNKRYKEMDHPYGKEPNQFFKEQIDKLEKGKILFPGDGDGRNGVYAAKLGWDVTIVEYSEEAIKKSMMFAEKENVALNYINADLTEIDFGENKFDCIVLVFVHLPENDRKNFHINIQKALKPGGLLIMQVYEEEQLKYNTGGPKELSLLYTLEEVVTDFQEMDFILLSKEVDMLNEGNLHNGEASVINFTAKK